MSEVEAMREGIAKQYGIELYKLYNEPQAAHFIGLHVDQLKKMRRAGKTPYVDLGPRKKRYLGIHIVDLIGYGGKWASIPDGNSKSVTSGSPSGKEAPHGAEPSLTLKPVKPDAYHLAQTALRSPSRD